MRRRPLVVAAIFLAAAAGAGAYRVRLGSPPAVEVVAVRRGTIAASFTADGVVKGKTVDLAASVAGRVRALRVVEGQPVAARQVLVLLDDREWRAGVREAQAAVQSARILLAQAEAALVLAREQAAAREAQAKAHLAAARAQLTQTLAGPRPQEVAQAHQQVEMTRASLSAAEQAVRRARQLHAAGGLARADLDEAEARYEVARAQHRAATEALDLMRAGARPEERAAAAAQVEAAQAQLEAARAAWQEVALRRADLEASRARVAQAEAALARAEVALASTALTAPFDGVVSRIAVEVGQMVTPAMPLLTLVNPRDLWISADVADEDAAKVHEGQEVIVTAPAFPGRRFRGHVRSLATAAETKPDAAIQTRVVRVTIRLEDGLTLLRPGLEVDVEGTAHVVASALVVPSDAVLLRDDRTAVFVVEDGVAKLREVRPGYSNFVLTEILAGLRDGELVIVRGKDGLADGQRVKIARVSGD
ncbi:MAG: efflux RND transporter periplasmic adaptor subunit [Armatimonadota bacterium]|nr:efflux RND transporter periplasmic adaptor subunit [Armatimonadota bacterium]